MKKYKVAKHFAVEIGDGRLGWSRKQQSIDREKALDGIDLRIRPINHRLEDRVRAHVQGARGMGGCRPLDNTPLRVL